MLNEACQSAWLAHHLPVVRKFSANQRTTFMQPLAGDEENYHFISSASTAPTPVQTVIRNAWEPHATLEATVTKHACATPAPRGTISNTGTCPAGTSKRLPSWTLQVTSPVAGSIYTWHILRPDGAYEPRSYGSVRTYFPPMEGVYHIGLQEDNLGLPLSDHPNGNRFYDIRPADVTAQATCCSPFSGNPEGARPLTLTPVSAEEFRRRLATDALATSAGAGADFSVTVYPNPVAGALSVNLLAPQAGTVGLRVSNVLGQDVGTGVPAQPVAAGEQTLTLDTSALPQGVYLLRVTLNNVTQVKQFVKL